MTTPAENAATVREALEGIAYRSPANNAQGNLNIAREKAVLSLPALAALEAQAEQPWWRGADEMRAELRAAEAERDRQKQSAEEWHGLYEQVLKKLIAAEAERDRLRERLSELDVARELTAESLARVEELKAVLRRCHDEAGGDTGSTVRQIARAALDKDTA